MLSPLVIDFLKSAMAPAAVVAALFLAVGGLRDPLRARLQSLIWAGGMLAGCYVLIGRLNFPPHDVNEALSWSALVLALFVWLGPHGLGSRYMIRAFFVLALGLMTLWPIRDVLHGQVQTRNLLAFFFLGLGCWSIVEKAAQKVKLLTLIALPLVVATALSLFLLFKGSASLSQLVSVMCALLGGVAVVALIAPKRVSAAAVLPFVSVFIVLFMACGHFYLDINPWHLILLCLPFFILWIRAWIPLIPHSPFAEAVTLGVFSAVPLGYFLWTVYQASGPLF